MTRLLKDIGLFDAAGPDGGSGARGGDGNTSNLGPPPSGTDTLTGKSAPAPAAGAGAGAAGRGGCPPNPSARTGLTANGGAAPPATVTTATSPAFCSPPTPPTPTPGAGQGQQHDPAIMAYLTKLLAFPEADAARALSNTSGNDLAAALDYLCLHTDDAGLKRGFRRGGSGGRGGGGGKGGGPAGIGGSSKIGGGAGGGRNVSAAARVGRKALAATPIEVRFSLFLFLSATATAVELLYFHVLCRTAGGRGEESSWGALIRVMSQSTTTTTSKCVLERHRAVGRVRYHAPPSFFQNFLQARLLHIEEGPRPKSNDALVDVLRELPFSLFTRCFHDFDANRPIRHRHYSCRG